MSPPRGCFVENRALYFPHSNDVHEHGRTIGSPEALRPLTLCNCEFEASDNVGAIPDIGPKISVRAHTSRAIAVGVGPSHLAIAKRPASLRRCHCSFSLRRSLSRSRRIECSARRFSASEVGRIHRGVLHNKFFGYLSSFSCVSQSPF